MLRVCTCSTTGSLLYFCAVGRIEQGSMVTKGPKPGGILGNDQTTWFRKGPVLWRGQGEGSGTQILKDTTLQEGRDTRIQSQGKKEKRGAKIVRLETGCQERQ